MRKVKQISTVDDLKTRIRNMFFESMKNDFDKWYKDGRNFCSPKYGDSQLVIDDYYDSLMLFDCTRAYDYDNRFSKKIIKFRGIFKRDKEINKWVKRLDQSFKKKAEDQANQVEISFLKNGLSNIEKNFTKAIRKEKLKSLGEDETKIK